MVNWWLCSWCDLHRLLNWHCCSSMFSCFAWKLCSLTTCLTFWRVKFRHPHNFSLGAAFEQDICFLSSSHYHHGRLNVNQHRLERLCFVNWSFLRHCWLFRGQNCLGFTSIPRRDILWTNMAGLGCFGEWTRWRNTRRFTTSTWNRTDSRSTLTWGWTCCVWETCGRVGNLSTVHITTKLTADWSPLVSGVTVEGLRTLLKTNRGPYFEEKPVTWRMTTYF